MKKKIILISIIIFSLGGLSMSIFGKGNTCVFSEVKLRLTLNGKPVANVKVTRDWEWNKPNSDHAITDENGFVSFPAVFESSISKYLPVELVIAQGLSIEQSGEKVVFWANAKREPEENSEYGGAPFHVECELSDEKVIIKDYGSLMATQCKLIKKELL